MKLFGWIFLLPVAVVLIAFSIANRDAVDISLWPLPFALAAPVFMVVLAAAAAGFLGGGLIAWLSAGRTRRVARQRTFQLEDAGRELRQARQRIDRLEAAAKSAPPATLDDVA